MNRRIVICFSFESNFFATSPTFLSVIVNLFLELVSDVASGASIKKAILSDSKEKKFLCCKLFPNVKTKIILTALTNGQYYKRTITTLTS